MPGVRRKKTLVVTLVIRFEKIDFNHRSWLMIFFELKVFYGYSEGRKNCPVL